jgi:outer membrane protein TolC
MKAPRNFAIRITAPVLALAGAAFGQFGQQAQTATPRAAQLPLSGKSGQFGSVSTASAPVPGATSSINTLSPAIQVSGDYSGSVRELPAFTGRLTLREAIQRGIRSNLAAIGFSNQVRQAQGLEGVARSRLLPNVNAHLTETLQTFSLATIGLTTILPGILVPRVIGPFNYFDLRATLSETLDFTSWNNYKSGKHEVAAARLSDRNARDLVVYGVGGAYLQALAAAARVESAQAQVATAEALLKQTSERHAVGLVAQIDVNRARVEMLTQRQRLLTIQNDLSKKKINLARMIGIQPAENFELGDDVPLAAAPPITETDAVVEGLRQRADVQAAQAQVEAANRTLAAARAERWPTLAFNTDYGVIGVNPGNSNGTYTVSGTLSVPVWQGGRISADIEQASAALAQRKAELEDLQSEVEANVREAFLDMQAAANQVTVAKENIDVAKQNLDLSRQRFEAGVVDNLEVVRAQELVSTAELDYIDSVFAYNVAKLGLARAMGRIETDLPRFLPVTPRP